MFLAFLIWIITLITMYGFASGKWSFPVEAATHAHQMDRQFYITLVVCGIIFFLAQMGLGWAMYRYRDRTGAKATYSHGNVRLELIWTAATAILFLTLNLMGQKVWAELRLQAAPAEAIRIEVWGQQFVWNVRYPGKDGQFGRIDARLMSDSSGNPLGLDDKDPAGKDDIVVPTMAVPVNHPVEIILRAKDVTHSFFVRELRVKQDAVPGMAIPIHFTPTRIGIYEVACAELCGLGHYKMRSTLEVLSEEDYQKWLKERAPQ
ncbi:MAG TPA: cytochrome c oxidase subunit II [Acidobacteriota bacterium]|jgi:cytochrome c oxidase subunit 2|nr:cytochrome c oxidase subunit II [Acidobacteriota bacterium]